MARGTVGIGVESRLKDELVSLSCESPIENNRNMSRINKNTMRKRVVRPQVPRSRYCLVRIGRSGRKDVAQRSEELFARLILTHTPKLMGLLKAAERRIKKGQGNQAP
jgi:hypothetical protein